MPTRIVVLTGASGSGKTAIAAAIAAVGAVQVFFFDSIGVPPVSDMIARYGSPEGWQGAMTGQWLERLSQLDGDILLEGQMRGSFIAAVSSRTGVDCRVVLADCDDATRTRRLTVDRGQPQLASPDMMNWAAFLRAEAKAAGIPILDTSARSVDASAAAMLAYFTP